MLDDVMKNSIVPIERKVKMIDALLAMLSLELLSIMVVVYKNRSTKINERSNKADNNSILLKVHRPWSTESFKVKNDRDL